MDILNLNSNTQYGKSFFTKNNSDQSRRTEDLHKFRRIVNVM